MATKIPLVLGSNGSPQQLQAGDTISVAASLYNSRAQINGEGTQAIVIGAPVYPSAAGTVKRAQANASGTTNVVGLALTASTAAGATGDIVVEGILVATTAQWDAVTGATGGLVFNTAYFLDPANPGKITSTPPTTVGQYVVYIGRALSTTELDVQIGQPILL